MKSLFYVRKSLRLKASDYCKTLETKKNQSDVEIRKIKSEINKIRVQQKNAQNRMEFIQDSELFDSVFFQIDSADNKKYELLREEINQIEKIIKTKKMIERSNSELKVLTDSGGTNKVESIAGLIKRRERLERAETRIERILNKKGLLKEELKKQYERLYKNVTAIPEKLSLSELEEPIENLLKLTLGKRASLQDKLNYLTSFKQSVDQNTKVAIDVQALEKKKKEIDTKMEEYQKKIGPLQQLINNVGELLGNSAMDFLNTPQSAIQKYYRYLNPLPTSKPVRFEGSDLNLKIMVPTSSDDNGSISNAQHTLSSGQLNVLAMAIFLAINESQRVSKLDFVAIDDPIQNMDDVNQFSICDVLGGLRKQLVFSTHDINFVKLFVKKNEYQQEDIQLYILESPHLTNSKVRRVTFN